MQNWPVPRAWHGPYGLGHGIHVAHTNCYSRRCGATNVPPNTICYSPTCPCKPENALVVKTSIWDKIRDLFRGNLLGGLTASKKKKKTGFRVVNPDVGGGRGGVRAMIRRKTTDMVASVKGRRFQSSTVLPPEST